jgi:SAM-dependent methyltransferase
MLLVSDNAFVPAGLHMTTFDDIGDLYRRHHAESRPRDFVFCEPERTAIFRGWVGGPGLSVLDLGCRDGALTRSYVAGNTVVGVDIDGDALARAADLGIETLRTNLDEGLPLPAETFDVVVAGELLEHLRFPERTIAEANRLLKPGGTLVGSVPNSYRLKNRLRFLLGKPPDPGDDPTQLHMFSRRDVTRLLAPFSGAEIRYVAGRMTRLHPRFFGNVIVFRAWKQRD